MSVVNIARHLPSMAARQPDATAVVFAKSGETWSFAHLDAESDAMAWGLSAAGIERGTRTVLMVPPGPAFFALTFALFKMGAIPVVVDPGMGITNLGRCLAEAEPEAFVGIPKAHLARVLFRWARPSLRIRIGVGGPPVPGGLSLGRLRRKASGRGRFAPAETTADETAAILFTSGSTGVPKGVVYSHGIFEAQVDLLKRVYGIEPGEVDLPTFPLFALFDPALGMTAVIPDMDFTRPGRVRPSNILDPIRRYRVTNAFGSPALLDRVSRHAARAGIQLPTLRRVVSAGAPASPRILARFASLLEGDAQVFTPYGATESLPVCNIGSREFLEETAARTAAGEGVCVGATVPEVEARIIPIRDEAIPRWDAGLELPDGEVGEIVVRGPVVTREYFRRASSTALAKIEGPGDGTLYHRMGDLGWRDERGRLWFCGRKAHRVKTSNGDMFTVPCEGVFNAHPSVRRTALVGVGEPGAARPVICVELDPEATDRDRGRITRELRELGAAQEPTRAIDTFLFHPSFPVDIRHNAKIFREKLAGWATRRLAR